MKSVQIRHSVKRFVNLNETRAQLTIVLGLTVLYDVLFYWLEKTTGIDIAETLQPGGKTCPRACQQGKMW